MVFLRPTFAAAALVVAAVLLASGHSSLQAQAAPNLSGIWQRTRTVAPEPGTAAAQCPRHRPARGDRRVAGADVRLRARDHPAHPRRPV